MKRIAVAAVVLMALLSVSAFTAYVPLVATDRPVAATMTQAPSTVTPTATATLVPPTPTTTPVLPTATQAPPTSTPTQPLPTTTPVLPTATQAPPTSTPTQPLPTNTPIPTVTPHWVNLISDGGFELGTLTPWFQYSNGGYQLIDDGVSSTPGGNYVAYLCDRNLAIDAIGQLVTVPSDAIQGAIGFDWAMFTEDNPAVAKDFLRLWITDQDFNRLEQVGGVDNTAAMGQWMSQVTYDLSAYRGQTIGVEFECRTDSAYRTAWLVDGVVFGMQVP